MKPKNEAIQKSEKLKLEKGLGEIKKLTLYINLGLLNKIELY